MDTRQHGQTTELIAATDARKSGSERFNGPSALLTAEELSELLGHSQSWFYAHRTELERAGFPKRDPLLGRWHKGAVDIWLARRAGTHSTVSAASRPSKLREAIDAHADALRNAAG